MSNSTHKGQTREMGHGAFRRLLGRLQPRDVQETRTILGDIMGAPEARRMEPGDTWHLTEKFSIALSADYVHGVWPADTFARLSIEDALDIGDGKQNVVPYQQHLTVVDTRRK